MGMTPHEAARPLLTIRDVIATTTLSESTIRRRMADSTFPQPIRLSGGRIAWEPNAVEMWRKDPRASNQPAREKAAGKRRSEVKLSFEKCYCNH